MPERAWFAQAGVGNQERAQGRGTATRRTIRGREHLSPGNPTAFP